MEQPVAIEKGNAKRLGYCDAPILFMIGVDGNAEVRDHPFRNEGAESRSACKKKSAINSAYSALRNVLSTTTEATAPPEIQVSNGPESQAAKKLKGPNTRFGPNW